MEVKRNWETNINKIMKQHEREYGRKNYLKNREKYILYSKQYYLDNKEACIERHRLWYLKNKSRIRKQQNEYRRK